MKSLFKASVLALAFIGFWNLVQAIWAYHNFSQDHDIAYLRNDSQPVNLSTLLCGNGDRQGRQLLDMAILAAAAYPSVDPSLLPRLSPNWEEIPFSAEDRSRLFPEELISGLDFGLWYDRANDTAVISFRGTDEAVDWHANFHWLFKNLGINTQYQKVHTAVPELVAYIKSNTEGLKEIHTVGQSLGGGLAQHALYSHADITQAFVFNSSPVTGWTDLDEDKRSDAVEGNIVTRIHEDGEVLEFLRLLMKAGYVLNPKPNANPFFEEYRFNFKNKVDPIGTHEMSWLAGKMIEKADEHCNAARPAG